MNKYNLAVVMSCAAWLSACATLPSGETTEPAAEPLAAHSDNTAVVALLDTVRQDTAAGKFDSAAATLERALRIEPRNASLWHQLARARLSQGQSGQAIQLANKSNTLAADDNQLRAENWLLIGQARTQRGDYAGAEAAYAQAEKLRGR